MVEIMAEDQEGCLAVKSPDVHVQLGSETPYVRGRQADFYMVSGGDYAIAPA
jgi:hypothetical protein